ncbi:tripartite tricarboxylate transporter substrate binding protein [Pigmentiphaga sp. GD03639]|uniref:Tripartite tricarboxylate transporter substrate binding protein n=1 Tax=Pigmentiphaga daeguensis TaxID=414049 RepID=A0ABP3MTS6_9BURK|nr:tripartite tricarboxylate transporter substrate binding protein [Pigmentiphaga sp. GD03639]MDH2239560.1 tripartite tricarboxylate transporter substrate binding protein [Pigmentiphaga sp. GD03639]
MALRKYVLRTCVAAAFASLGLSGAASAQGYPTRPVTMVVPFAAGGSSDILARAFGASLAARLGQPVIIENKPGAGGIIASDYVARAQPDGYTLLFGTIGTHAINPVLKKTLPFDVAKSFTAIGRLQDGPLVLVVNPSLQVKNLQGLIDYARANPDKLSYASAGIGAISHLAGELFKSEAKVEIVHVPYKGGGAAMPDLLGGQVQLMLETIPNTLASVRAGKLRALAISSDKRSAALPDVPTFKESGLKGLDVTTWTGLFGPANLPADIASRLNAEIAKVAADRDYIARIEQTGSEVAKPMSREQFAAFVGSEVARWRNVAQAAGVQPE